MLNITYVHECECGGEAVNRVCDFTQTKEGEVKIDFAFSCSQMDLTCEKCGKKYYTGDIDVLSEEELGM